MQKQNTLFRAIVALFTAIIVIRLTSLALYPLTNTTEARYAEMSRKVLELKEWIIIYFDYGAPFWGKPPLSFWAQSLGMWLFGINEFGARFGAFCVGIFCCALFFAWDFRRESHENKALRPLLCALIFMTSIVGFVASGAVMTDIYLLFSTMLCMVGFYNCVMRENFTRCKLWGYAFFLGIALGLLSKGPLIFVLVGAPIVLFAIFARFSQIKLKWQNLPIFSGITLTLIIALPWYILAELTHEDKFLEYFIIGEHFKRFLVSGWAGDLYGSAHKEPRGMIWIFFLAAFLPWSVVFLAFLGAKAWRLNAKNTPLPHALKSQIFANPSAFYLALWLLIPLLFFTLSRNILATYTLPCAPALCIFLANFIYQSKFRHKILVVPAILIFALCGALIYGVEHFVAHRHYKDLFSRYDGKSQLIFIGKPSYSAEFYARQKRKESAIFFEDDLAKLGKSLRESRELDLGDSNARIAHLHEILNQQCITIALKESTYNAHKEKFKNFTPKATQNGWILLENF